MISVNQDQKIAEILELLEALKQALSAVHGQLTNVGAPSQAQAALNIRDEIEKKVRALSA